MDPATLAELRALVTVMRHRALSSEYFLDKDLEFHGIIYRPVNNRVLAKLLEIFYTIYRNLRNRSLLVTRNPIAEVDKHHEILHAIEDRDAARVERLMRDHFTGMKERIRAVQLAMDTASGAPTA